MQETTQSTEWINQQKKIVVRQGGLLTTPRINSNISNIISTDKSHIKITFFPNDDLFDFENEIAKHLKKLGRVSVFRFRLDASLMLLASFLVALSILLILGILSTYEDLFKSLLTEKGALDNWETIVFIATSLVLTFGIAFFPSAISSIDDQNGAIRLVRGWYNKDERVKNRLRFGIQQLATKQNKNIIIWNPYAHGQDSWILHLFIPVLLEMDLKIIFYLKSDEIETFLELINNTEKKKNIWSKKEYKNPTYKKLKGYEQYNRFFHMLEAYERLLLELFIVLSTYNFSYFQKTKINFAELRGLLSLELLAYSISKYVGQILADKVIGTKQIHLFFRRCINDYNIIERLTSDGDIYWHLSKQLLQAIDLPSIRQRHRYIHLHIETEIAEALNNVEDPVGIWIIYFLMEENNAPTRLKTKVLSAAIDRTRLSEAYSLISFFKIIMYRNKFGSNQGFLKHLQTTSLHKTIPLLERAGHFEEAIRICKYLYPTNTIKYQLIEARLNERAGHYSNALQLLRSIETQIPHTKNNQNLLEFNLKRTLLTSWVIVSGRIDTEKSYGKKCLKKANSILTVLKSYGKDLDTNLIWHAYNTTAQYHEWEKNYPACIKYLQRCLNLPGVEIKWISGTYVNLGIAYRERYINGSNDMNDLEHAVSYGKEGVQLKRNLGDRDELPIALHNLALSQLYHFKINRDQNILKEAYDNAKWGFKITEDTGSTKKRGHLLAELLIAQTLLNNKTHIHQIKEKLISWINDEASPDEHSYIINFISEFDLSLTAC